MANPPSSFSPGDFVEIEPASKHHSHGPLKIRDVVPPSALLECPCGDTFVANFREFRLIAGQNGSSLIASAAVMSHSYNSLYFSPMSSSNAMPKKKRQTNSTSTFKVGDVCVVKSGAASECGNYRDIDNEAKFIQITDINGHNNFHYDILDAKRKKVGQCNGCFSFDDLELAKEPKPKPKKELNPKALDALIVPETVKTEIVSVLNQHGNADTLFNTWGLGEMIEYGRGMTFMFYGPPGTGKTWGATCIAKAMDMELLVLSAAEVQSSEPGGANRAIAQAFATAKAENKVLFIDECDSLIASRAHLGMVLASEVNTLLTEIERAEGVVILATNRIEHMDEALERRLALIVEFPRPDYDLRLKIWKKMIPAKFPLHAEVKPEELAQLDLSGGQIKNVLLQAARLAVANKEKVVKQSHFDTAIARLKKSSGLMGKDNWDQRKEGPSVGVGKELHKVRDFLTHHRDMHSDNKH